MLVELLGLVERDLQTALVVLLQRRHLLVQLRKQVVILALQVLDLVLVLASLPHLDLQYLHLALQKRDFVVIVPVSLLQKADLLLVLLALRDAPTLLDISQNRLVRVYLLSKVRHLLL